MSVVWILFAVEAHYGIVAPPAAYHKRGDVFSKIHLQPFALDGIVCAQQVGCAESASVVRHIQVVCLKYCCYEVFYILLLFLAFIREFIYSGIQIICGVQTVAPLLAGLAHHLVSRHELDEMAYLVRLAGKFVIRLCKTTNGYCCKDDR